MSTAQIAAILAVAVPALVVVLWPVLGRAGHPAAAGATPPGRTFELDEEKTAILRALREIDFDHDAGHLSDDDHAGLRSRYEGRAAQIVTELDRLRPVPAPAPPAARAPAAGGRPWTRHPATVAAGAVLLLLFGVLLGVNAGRFSAPEPAPPMAGPPIPTAPTPPPASALPPGIGSPGAAAAPSDGAARPLSPEMLAGMLQAARQSLAAGRYQEAIAAYQAVLKRDTRNVDAMTHLGLIVAIGGHADAALEAWAKALAVDPAYPPAYLYRGQVLYEVKQDYAGAVHDWERFVALVPAGADHDRVVALLADARQKRGAR